MIICFISKHPCDVDLHYPNFTNTETKEKELSDLLKDTEGVHGRARINSGILGDSRSGAQNEESPQEHASAFKPSRAGMTINLCHRNTLYKKFNLFYATEGTG